MPIQELDNQTYPCPSSYLNINSFFTSNYTFKLTVSFFDQMAGFSEHMLLSFRYAPTLSRRFPELNDTCFNYFLHVILR